MRKPKYFLTFSLTVSKFDGEKPHESLLSSKMSREAFFDAAPFDYIRINRVKGGGPSTMLGVKEQIFREVGEGR